MLCPNYECKKNSKCNLIQTEEAVHYAKKTRFICSNCKTVACVYCGYPPETLCDSCYKETSDDYYFTVLEGNSEDYIDV